uniref:Uncharacterized protein n=1 Tax=Ralstonia solanacearum TaxID=305 RepID=A0A0S4WE16_RALSL|nr:protein of unknown function [Ralstonia solanacearum]
MTQLLLGNMVGR